jgi:hypothetical protein
MKAMLMLDFWDRMWMKMSWLGHRHPVPVMQATESRQKSRDRQSILRDKTG